MNRIPRIDDQPRTAAVTVEMVQRLEFKHLPCPYSPDLALSDYHVWYTEGGAVQLWGKWCTPGFGSSQKKKKNISEGMQMLVE